MRDYADVLKQARTCANRKYCDLGGNCEYYDLDVCCQGGEKDILKDAADAIEELLDAVPHWISVEERLPEKWKPVLAFDPIGYGEIGIAFIVGSLNTVVWRGVGFTNTAYPPNVTHWMPLPEPPSGFKEVQDG